MRTGYIILFLIVLTNVFGQKPKSNEVYPFQVVYAENCKNKGGQTLTSFDYLSIEDEISIGIDGTITLIHYTGLPIEIKNDTLIHVKSLHEKAVKKIRHTSDIDRPRIENLLVADWKLITEKNLKATFTEWNLPIICPFNINNRIYISSELYIKWGLPNLNEFKIRLTNMFDEDIIPSSVSTHEFRMDSLSINKILQENDLLILNIESTSHGQYRKSITLLKYPFPNFRYDFSCETKSPSMALLLGYYNEIHGMDSQASAEYFYVLATKLSDKEFYKTMLDNYYKRKIR